MEDLASLLSLHGPLQDPEQLARHSSQAVFFAVLPAQGDCPTGNMHFHLNACYGVSALHLMLQLR